MFKKGARWYKDKTVAEKYDKNRFTRGGEILDIEEKKIVQKLVRPSNKRILDIATGTGRFAEFLSRKGRKVIGLDASKEMLRNRTSEYVQGNGFQLPFRDKVFDVTISMRFLHLLKPDDIQVFIGEVERVTKEKMVFETLHPFSLRMMYQWMLPQNSHMYSNSFIRDKLNRLVFVKKIRFFPNFLIPYGMYQVLPMELAKKINRFDKKIVDNYKFLASTVYWEVFFKEQS